MCRECLDSVLGQPFADWELVAVVETSKDRTEEIVREYAAKDSRISVFTQPRSGSPAAPRNTALEHATGEYVIFLDSDDRIAEGSLQRLHDKIAARPGADLYPCAIQVENEITGKNEPVRDNYPADFNGELTGQEATLLIYGIRRDPCPMLQLSVFRLGYLVEKGLKCQPGRKREDSEFAPRALFLAGRVRPIHVPFYIYRIRNDSVTTLAKGPDYYLGDYAEILKSLLSFHAEVSRRPGFDRMVSACWARHWLTWIFYNWFSTRSIRKASRARRQETLRSAFPDGFADFDRLCCASTAARRVAARFVKLFVRCPSLGWLADAFFLWVYNPLVGLRDGMRGAG